MHKGLWAHMGYRDKGTRLRVYFGGFDPIVTSSAMRLSGCLTFWRRNFFILAHPVYKM